MKVRIKSFNGELPDYLTLSKVYNIRGRREGEVTIFSIYDDTNERVWILLEECAHLNGGEWEVVE